MGNNNAYLLRALRNTAELVRQELLSRTAEAAGKRFHKFLTDFAWPVLQPGTPFVDNWHIHAICEHLEAVTRGEINRLIVSMPFRMLKSTIISQAWPAWEWTQLPSTQFLTASYAKDLATRDAVDSRRIMESHEYRLCWGHKFEFTSDQNVKTRFENNRRGTRTVLSTDSSGTGFGGNRIVWDDPISAKEADNELARKSAVEFWKGTLRTRFNDAAKDAAVITHQRFHVEDPTGYILANETESNWDHLVLPMRFDAESRKTTSLGYVDPRKNAGELLMPQRLSEPVVREMEKGLGAYHTSAQLNQNPEPRGGIIFDRNYWKFYKVLPELDEVIISVDCAFKDTKNSDYVAIQAWGRKGANKYLLRRLRERLGFAATVLAVRGFKQQFPKSIAILIEDKANGPAVVETLQKEVAGIIPVNPEGGKTARAFAMQPEHEAGNLWLPDPSIDAGVEVYLTELSSFDGNPSKHDDEVDGTTQAINWFRTRERSMGLLNWMREEVKHREAA